MKSAGWMAVMLLNGCLSIMLLSPVMKYVRGISRIKIQTAFTYQDIQENIRVQKDFYCVRIDSNLGSESISILDGIFSIPENARISASIS